MSNKFGITSDTDLAHRALLLSCTSPSASLIFTIVPTEFDYELSNTEFNSAIRFTFKYCST